MHDLKHQRILPLRDQARVVNGWLASRIKHVLPAVMKREGFDMWIVVAREYNEDPVLLSLLPAPAMSARRRTILVFSRSGDEVKPLAVDRLSDRSGSIYRSVWDPDQGDQWQCLGRLVAEEDPASIGINCCETFAFGDGLTFTEHAALMEALGERYASRARGAGRLAVGWLEQRLPQELDAYPAIVALAHEVIAEAYSLAAVLPGVTSASDLAWWLRQRITDLGLPAWFQPSVSIRRWGSDGADEDVIMPGDLLHCDVGLHYLGLATDTQRLAYVLRSGETDAPAGLKSLLRQGNQLQDILAGQLRPGRTGNQILAAALAEAEAAGIRGAIYTHPIGYHGHGAGPTIGLWDNQAGVPGRGDYPLYANTCHAMELSVTAAVDEWDGQRVTIGLEEDIAVTESGVQFMSGRQTALYLIG